jgi:hypothetical protein
MPVPQGTSRDGNGNLYAVGITEAGDASTMVRFAQTGVVLDVWDAGGLAVTVTPDGSAAFVLAPDDATILGYGLSVP